MILLAHLPVHFTKMVDDNVKKELIENPLVAYVAGSTWPENLFSMYRQAIFDSVLTVKRLVVDAFDEWPEARVSDFKGYVRDKRWRETDWAAPAVKETSPLAIALTDNLEQLRQQSNLADITGNMPDWGSYFPETNSDDAEPDALEPRDPCHCGSGRKYYLCHGFDDAHDDLEE